MTPEQKQQKDKEAFMMQYYGQKVFMPYDKCLRPEKVKEQVVKMFPNCYLSLRSIESLMDEECMEVAKIMLGSEYKERTHAVNPVIRSKDHIRVNIQAWFVTAIGFGGALSLSDMGANVYKSVTLLAAYDYLRSIGILLPFREYSVEQIQSLGWAQYQGGVEQPLPTTGTTKQ